MGNSMITTTLIATAIHRSGFKRPNPVSPISPFSPINTGQQTQPGQPAPIPQGNTPRIIKIAIQVGR